MKRSLLQLGVCLATAWMVVGSSSAANGQGHEYIVGAQVVSDTAMEPSVVSDSYVGDMSMASAGCQSCGNGCSGCSGGVCGGCGSRGCSGPTGGCAGGPWPRSYGKPDLFYNYYTQGYNNRVNAQLYVSPLPVPPNVGHTFFTYQPFYPHEMMYWHKNRFHNYYDEGRGMNRTKVRYYSPPVRQALSNLYWNKIRLPR